MTSTEPEPVEKPEPNVEGAPAGEESPTDNAPPATADLVDLGSAGPMLPVDANRIASKSRTAVVVMVGEAESGKSSLLSAIYVRLLNEPFQHFRFAGSKTLAGFDARSYLALARSGIHSPNTPRTIIQERQTFLHLTLSNATTTERADLLVGDMSGEYFERVIDEATLLSDLTFLPRADLVSLIVDGARIADAGQRHLAAMRARQLIRRLLEAKATLASRIQIVVAKWDLIRAAGRDAEEFLDAHIADIRRLHPDLEAVAVLRTAARTQTNLVPAGTGVEELVLSWTSRRASEMPDSPHPAPERAFDLFDASTDEDASG